MADNVEQSLPPLPEHLPEHVQEEEEGVQEMENPIPAEIRVEILQNEEEFYDEWIAKLEHHIKVNTYLSIICKVLYRVILIPTMILSFIFGASGTMSATSSEKILDLQNIFLLVVGILTTLLNLTKLEKRAAKHKIKYRDFDTLLDSVKKQKINYKRPDICKNFDDFFKIVRKEFNRIDGI